MPTQTLNIQKAKIHFSRLLEEVASGTEFIIAKAGKPIARLSRIEEARPKIRFGVLKGQGSVSEDFDSPLSDDVLSEFEGDRCGF